MVVGVNGPDRDVDEDEDWDDDELNIGRGFGFRIALSRDKQVGRLGGLIAYRKVWNVH